MGALDTSGYARRKISYQFVEKFCVLVVCYVRLSYRRKFFFLFVFFFSIDVSYKRLSCTFKMMKKEAPNYLINLIPKCNQTIRTRNSHISIFHCRTDCFKYSCFPSTLKDWFNLDINIRNSESISVFKNRLLSLIRPYQKSVFNVFDPKPLVLLNSLRIA